MTFSTAETSSQPAADTRRPVFISYATADRVEALKVCEAIERRGTACWIACRDVEPGENYQEAIVAALRRSRAMVLIFSDAANNSDEIKKELSLVSRFHVPLMALRLENVEPSDAFAYELSTRQWIDLFTGWDRSLDQLVGRIDAVSPLGAAGASIPANADGQRSRPLVTQPAPARRRTLIAATAAVGIAAVATGGWFAMRPAAKVEHPLEVRLGDFQRLSPDLPAGLPQAMRDEISAAFAKDGTIGVSTAPTPPPGSKPAYVLNATVRKDADKLRVVARLANDHSGTMLWSYSFDYPTATLGLVARKLAIDTGSLMRCGLFGASTYPGAVPDPVLKDYLSFCQASGIVEFEPTKALDSARKVVAALPDFSWGWAAVESAAGAAMGSASTPVAREAMRKTAFDAAAMAIKLDPANSEALLGKAFLIDQRDRVGRERLLKQAIAARPLACECQHHAYTSFLFEVGRLDAAIGEAQRASDVRPLDGNAKVMLGMLMLEVGRAYDGKAQIEAGATLTADPHTPGLTAMLAAPFTGEWAAALTAARDPIRQSPEDWRVARIATFEAMIANDPAAKAAAARQLMALPVKSGGQVKIDLLAALGAYDAALASVEAQAADGPGIAAGLYSPLMAPGRKLPQFAALVQRVGLVDYWRRSKTRPDFCTAKDAPPVCATI